MKILIIGGDYRTLSLKEILTENNHTISCCFLNQENSNNFKNINNFDMILLPVPIERNCKLNAPFYKEEIEIHDIFKHLKFFKGKIIGGFTKFTKELSQKYNINYMDILKDEKFALINAIITAEGSIEKLINQSKKSLFDSDVCILGYGRVGKALARRLDPLCKNLIVYNNPSIKLTYSKIDNIKSHTIDLFKSEAKIYDIIINTIPHKIITKELLQTLHKETLILDLSSIPGGVDFEYAKKMNIKVIHYLGVPNKVSKYSAAKTIYNFIQENIK